MFNVSISVNDEKILGELVVDRYFFEPSKYEYAFYLYKDGKRIEVVWYTKNVKAEFSIENMTGTFFVKIFIKDIEYQNIRNYNSEKILIIA